MRKVMMLNFRKIGLVLILILIANVTACGTLLYPERKGQSPGKIDPAVAALDAAGLLFYFIPGIIAFVIDYNNGTLYLPKSGALNKSSDNNIDVVKLKNNFNNQEIERQINEKIQLNIDLENDAVIMTEVESLETVKHKISLL